MTTDVYWDQRAAEYAAVPNHSAKGSLHPAILEQVMLEPSFIALDYGCGYGRLLSLLVEVVQTVAGFEPSGGMRALVPSTLRSRLSHLYETPEQIPNDHYDVVICSLVLMTIGDRGDYHKTVTNIIQSAKIGGRIVVGVTHPCFRGSTFSDFATSLGTAGRSDYLTEGTPFKVFLHDGLMHVKTEFTNFHWSLTFTIRSFLREGADLIGLAELSDIAGLSDSNPSVPPYLVLTFRRALATASDSL